MKKLPSGVGTGRSYVQGRKDVGGASAGPKTSVRPTEDAPGPSRRGSVAYDHRTSTPSKGGQNGPNRTVSPTMPCTVGPDLKPGDEKSRFS
jgi:hypothetical protein